MNDFFTYSLYVNVCRSLFERHKLLLSLMLAVKTLQHAGSINPKEWRFLLAGPVSTGTQQRSSSTGAQDAVLGNPAPDWLTEKSWAELLGLSQLTAFNGFDEHVAANIEHYKAMFDSSEVSRGVGFTQPAVSLGHHVKPQAHIGSKLLARLWEMRRGLGAFSRAWHAFVVLVALI